MTDPISADPVPIMGVTGHACPVCGEKLLGRPHMSPPRTVHYEDTTQVVPPGPTVRQFFPCRCRVKVWK